MNKEELREPAIQTMKRLPRSIRRALRDVNAALGLLEALCAEEPNEEGLIGVTKETLQAACTILEKSRDRMTTVAQQARLVATVMDEPDAWRSNNSEAGER